MLSQDEEQEAGQDYSYAASQTGRHWARSPIIMSSRTLPSFPESDQSFRDPRRGDRNAYRTTCAHARLPPKRGIWDHRTAGTIQARIAHVGSRADAPEKWKD